MEFLIDQTRTAGALAMQSLAPTMSAQDNETWLLHVDAIRALDCVRNEGDCPWHAIQLRALLQDTVQYQSHSIRVNEEKGFALKKSTLLKMLAAIRDRDVAIRCFGMFDMSLPFRASSEGAY